jgi:enoyl-CoA hydratase
MSLFGERVEGPRAAELGLAWRCVADDELLDDAVALAANAADLAPGLAAALKQTLREAPWHADFEAAVQVELTRQRKTFEQGGGAS